MIKKNKIRAAIFPDPYDENHWIRMYSPLLFEISERMLPLGVDSIKVPEFPSLIWLMQNHSQIDVVHFHWPDFYYFRSNFANRLIGRYLTRFFKRVFNINIFYLIGKFWLFSFIKLCHLYKIPLIWTLHDLYPHHQPLEHLFEEKIIRTRLMKKVDAVIFTCKAAVPISSEHFGIPENYVVAPFGSYRIFYPDSINRKTARNYFNLSDDDIQFLFFGNQRPRRNAIELITAFHQLKNPNARLLVAGTTPTNLQKEIEGVGLNDPRIQYILTLIPNDKIEYIFKACDFVVMPGKDYLNSGVIALAISYGRPVIAQDFGCAREIIGDAGILFKNKNETTLYNLLIQAMKSDQQDLFAKAETRASNLDWQITAEKTLEAYKISLKKYGYGFT